MITVPPRHCKHQTSYDRLTSCSSSTPDRYPPVLNLNAPEQGVACRVSGSRGCIRGVATLTAFGLAVEIGDWHRLTGPFDALKRTLGLLSGMAKRWPPDAHQQAVQVARWI
ncbi:MAG TPA: hypothetical protein VMU34_01650, partial [Mycobacterium sp.]|nr:hypothetical protein [Mycobacterium sp.]